MQILTQEQKSKLFKPFKDKRLTTDQSYELFKDRALHVACIAAGTACVAGVACLLWFYEGHKTAELPLSLSAIVSAIRIPYGLAVGYVLGSIGPRTLWRQLRGDGVRLKALDDGGAFRSGWFGFRKACHNFKTVGLFLSLMLTAGCVAGWVTVVQSGIRSRSEPQPVFTVSIASACQNATSEGISVQAGIISDGAPTAALAALRAQTAPFYRSSLAIGTITTGSAPGWVYTCSETTPTFHESIYYFNADMNAEATDFYVGANATYLAGMVSQVSNAWINGTAFPTRKISAITNSTYAGSQSGFLGYSCVGQRQLLSFTWINGRSFQQSAQGPAAPFIGRDKDALAEVTAENNAILSVDTTKYGLFGSTDVAFLASASTKEELGSRIVQVNQQINFNYVSTLATPEQGACTDRENNFQQQIAEPAAVYRYIYVRLWSGAVLAVLPLLLCGILGWPMWTEYTTPFNSLLLLAGGGVRGDDLGKIWSSSEKTKEECDKYVILNRKETDDEDQGNGRMFLELKPEHGTGDANQSTETMALVPLATA
ncbi:hypothetical protein IE81DRAFT_332561 [Ceraceosorus guamensis]|uniref:Uncharacterized protein n=1 Tax=Ceraceosorus guamensis TaxID=1522189 RepID=A0A316VRU8_9BASI|nr:hypothetical protein IE81DRAFT_332561 [Ceraceosorus guamensis]PWN39133.1 hypothetical protein IE81DRAFT_332561 [Ceraceosorus guamensis]